MTRAVRKRLEEKNVLKAYDATSNWKFKGYENHDLEHPIRLKF